MALTVNRVGNPIKVTGTASSNEVIYPKGRPVFIKFVYWYSPTSSGHLLNLIDAKGDAIIPMIAEAAKDSQAWPVYSAYNGISCDDMDSGELYIYIA